jgi:hypothetical protein
LRAGNRGDHVLGCSALGFAFEVAVPDDLSAVAAALLEGLLAASDNQHRIEVVGDGDGRYLILADGELAMDDLEAAAVPGMLSWFVNQGTIRHAGDLLLFHAAVLCRDDRGVLIAAPSGSGKSTLAGALLAAGWSYLSDEIGALDSSTMRMLAYPKALSLATTSLELLGVADRVPEALAPLAGRSGKTELPPSAIRPGSSATSCGVELIVFPAVQPDSGAIVRRLGRAETLTRLLASSFNFVHHPETHFFTAAELCRRADGVELLFSDVDAACTVLDEAVSGVSPQRVAASRSAASESSGSA